MSPGAAKEYPPEEIGPSTWRVFGPDGAVTALNGFDHEAWLKNNPHSRFKLDFANRAPVRVMPDHPLVQTLAEIARFYEVVVTPHLGRPFTLDYEKLVEFEPSLIEIYNKPD